MINVIVPVVDRPQEYLSMLNEISKRGDCVVFVGALKKFSDVDFPKNVVLKYYKNASYKEEIINSLHSIPKNFGKTMVVRRPLAKEEFASLAENKADIAYLKKSKSRFASFWAGIWKKLIKKLFSFYYFEDISAICFSENTFNLINSLTNLSYVTRIDRFVGLKEEAVSSSEPSPKREYDKFDASVKLISWVLVLALLVCVSVLICTSFRPIAIMILISILLCTIGITALFLAILNFVRTLYVGTLRHGRAEECLNN